ncbi:hypothetical protein AAFF_G00272970 [Aldrovandia affinis]|uniref:Uncharacterized protein n=1 Tax=Aldrovandia affinis TaxID=143900 RepID=A0AAD7SRS0_9TELE|nr:hypothetical protein AAFF_G00272970 [Aldrovandia affinis]
MSLLPPRLGQAVQRHGRPGPSQHVLRRGGERGAEHQASVRCGEEDTSGRLSSVTPPRRLPRAACSRAAEPPFTERPVSDRCRAVSAKEERDSGFAENL